MEKRKTDEEIAAETVKEVPTEDQTVLSAGSSMKMDSKSKDIRLNFDVALPGLKILENATLTLASCARYGLVGRNGIGKTTLMKSIANKKINIPSHISVLFVEQEVMGDELTVLQSVLDADSERREVGFFPSPSSLFWKLSDRNSSSSSSSWRKSVWQTREIKVVRIPSGSTRCISAWKKLRPTPPKHAPLWC